MWQTTHAGAAGDAEWAAAYDRSLDKAFRVKLARRRLLRHLLERQWNGIDETIQTTRERELDPVTGTSVGGEHHRT